MNSRCLPTICATGHRASRRHWSRAHIELDGSPQPDTSAGNPCRWRVTPDAQLLFVGCQAIPKTVWLACLGWETVGAAGGDAVSLLQVRCPQGGGDVGRARAVAGAGCRRGRSAQGAAVRCAGQPKRIGQVRTEQACAGVALHFAWALGPAQDGARLARLRYNARPAPSANLQTPTGCQYRGAVGHNLLMQVGVWF